MKTEAIVKIIGEKSEGVSQVTGNAWRTLPLLLEWEDGEGMNRVWGVLFNEVIERFELQGIGSGDTCSVTLCFTTRAYRTGYCKTDARIIDIMKKQ